MNIPLEMIPPPAGPNVHWSEIRRYRPNPNNVLNNIMSDEVSSSCSPRRSAEVQAPLPPDEAAVPNISANNAINNGNRANSGNNVPDNTVGSSGIDEEMGQEPPPQNPRSIPPQPQNPRSVPPQPQNPRNVPQPRRPANEQARANGDNRPGRHDSRCRHDNTKVKVMKMIARSPGGILCRDLFRKFKKRYGVALKYNNLDYKNPMEMIEEMKLKIIMSRPQNANARQDDVLLTMAPPDVRGPIDLTGIVRHRTRGFEDTVSVPDLRPYLSKWATNPDN